MKKPFGVVVAVAGLSVLLTGLAFGYQSTLNFGALTTDRAYEERVSFGGPVGSGNPSGPFSQVRSEVLVPVDYGRLIAVTPLAGTGSAVFWYESQDGAVRNVMMNAANPVVIYRKGSLN